LRSPDDLRDAFHELRHEERRGVPPFRAQTRVSAPRYLRFAVVFAVLLLITATALLRRAAPERRPVNSGSISTWKAPTDFLLQTPESKLLRTVPTFGVPKKGTSS
jgi:hypothetical protein